MYTPTFKDQSLFEAKYSSATLAKKETVFNTKNVVIIDSGATA
jgi:hypothetical protein